MTRNFVQWFKQEAVDFNAKCAALGRTPASVIKEARDNFERIKCNFTGGAQDHDTIVLLGVHGADTPLWLIHVSSYDIKTFFDPVIAEIETCINTQLSAQTKALIIPGGFGDSM